MIVELAMKKFEQFEQFVNKTLQDDKETKIFYHMMPILLIEEAEKHKNCPKWP